MKGSSRGREGWSSLESVTGEVGSGSFAVLVAGSGLDKVPVRMSASQSPRPPGAASTAV